jgi:Tol biopolymer transport system component
VDCPAGKLAYVQDGDVWAKQLPDGTPQRLTTDGRSFAPAWSPSGDWLLFQKRANDSTPECWLVRADGTDARGIDGGADCAWSPANDTFASVQSGALTVENADGSGRRELLQRPDAVVLRDVAFVWSPDGAWLAYSRQERPVNGPASAWDYAAVWRVRPDGSDALQLVTASAGIDRNAGGASTVGFIPMGFTPDVRGVLYAVDPVASDAGTESMELRVVTMDRFAGLDGGQPFRTQFRVFPRYPDFLDYASDGSLVVFVAGSYLGSAFGDTWIDKNLAHYTSLGSGGLLPAEGKADVSPAVSPDSSSIVFASSPDFSSDVSGPPPPELNQRRIWIVRRGGGFRNSAVQLTDDPAYRDERPQWSKDGRHILFARLSTNDRSAPASLWSLELDSGSMAKVQDGLSVPAGDAVARGHVPWEQVFDWWQP